MPCLNLNLFKYRRNYPYNNTIREESDEQFSENNSQMTFCPKNPQFIFDESASRNLQELNQIHRVSQSKRVKSFFDNEALESRKSPKIKSERKLQARVDGRNFENQLNLDLKLKLAENSFKKKQRFKERMVSEKSSGNEAASNSESTKEDSEWDNLPQTKNDCSKHEETLFNFESDRKTERKLLKESEFGKKWSNLLYLMCKASMIKKWLCFYWVLRCFKSRDFRLGCSHLINQEFFDYQYLMLQRATNKLQEKPCKNTNVINKARNGDDSEDSVIVYPTEKKLNTKRKSLKDKLKLQMQKRLSVHSKQSIMKKNKILRKSNFKANSEMTRDSKRPSTTVKLNGVVLFSQNEKKVRKSNGANSQVSRYFFFNGSFGKNCGSDDDVRNKRLCDTIIKLIKYLIKAKCNVKICDLFDQLVKKYSLWNSAVAEIVKETKFRIKFNELINQIKKDFIFAEKIDLIRKSISYSLSREYDNFALKTVNFFLKLFFIDRSIIVLNKYFGAFKMKNCNIFFKIMKNNLIESKSREKYQFNFENFNMNKKKPVHNIKEVQKLNCLYKKIEKASMNKAFSAFKKLESKRQINAKSKCKTKDKDTQDIPRNRSNALNRITFNSEKLKSMKAYFKDTQTTKRFTFASQKKSRNSSNMFYKNIKLMKKNTKLPRQRLNKKPNTFLNEEDCEEYNIYSSDEHSPKNSKIANKQVDQDHLKENIFDINRNGHTIFHKTTELNPFILELYDQSIQKLVKMFNSISEKKAKKFIFKLQEYVGPFTTEFEVLEPEDCTQELSDIVDNVSMGDSAQSDFGRNNPPLAPENRNADKKGNIHVKNFAKKNYQINKYINIKNIVNQQSYYINSSKNLNDKKTESYMQKKKSKNKQRRSKKKVNRSNYDVKINHKHNSRIYDQHSVSYSKIQRPSNHNSRYQKKSTYDISRNYGIPRKIKYRRRLLTGSQIWLENKSALWKKNQSFQSKVKRDVLSQYQRLSVMNQNKTVVLSHQSSRIAKSNKILPAYIN